ncbi:MAG TPA: hypothetical protein DGK91_07315 [Clostridium sp.]|nr:hypothetical protein [Clostridium sp.]
MKRIHMERLVFLFFSMVIMFVVLYIANQADTIRNQEEKVKKAEYLFDIEEKYEHEVEVRKQVEIENDNIKKENEVLTDLLFNQSRMYEFAAIPKSSRSNYLSRSEQQMTLGTIPLSMPSGFTTQNLERAFSKLYPAMSGLGASFVLAEELYGVNCIVLVSIAILESGGGTSKIAKNKNNLCGLGACDGSAYKSAMGFESCADSIFFLAELLATQYAPDGRYFGGSYDLRGINVNYASDPKWAIKNSEKMIEIIQAGIESPEQLIEIANIKYVEGINNVQS